MSKCCIITTACNKKEIADNIDAEISEELKQCADEISKLDIRMQDIRRKMNL